MGRAKEAEDELRDFLKSRPVPDLGSTSPINPLYDTRYIVAHFEMGRASELLNNPQQAIDYYLKFLSFWGQADFKSEEVNAAKDRLRALAK